MSLLLVGALLASLITGLCRRPPRSTRITLRIGRPPGQAIA